MKNAYIYVHKPNSGRPGACCAESPIEIEYHREELQQVQRRERLLSPRLTTPPSHRTPLHVVLRFALKTNFIFGQESSWGRANSPELFTTRHSFNLALRIMVEVRAKGSKRFPPAGVERRLGSSSVLVRVCSVLPFAIFASELKQAPL